MNHREASAGFIAAVLTTRTADEPEATHTAFGSAFFFSSFDFFER